MIPLDLDYILSRACSNPSDEPSYNYYRIELHCVAFTVKAKPLGYDHVTDKAHFDIKSWRVESI